MTGILIGILLTLVGLGFISLLLITGYFMLLQDRMMYPACFRQRPAGLTPEDTVPEGFHVWRNTSGKYIGYTSQSPDSPAPDHAWLLLHGNRVYAQESERIAEPIQAICPLPHQIYILEYPGFGHREGRPSEPALVEAAVEAIGLIRRRHPKLHIIGRSLGSGVAMAAVRQKAGEVDSMALLTPFSSMLDAARNHIGKMIGGLRFLIPSAYLIRDHFRSDLYAPAYRGPVSLVAGELDDVTPPRMAKKLCGLFPGEAQLHIEPDTGHELSIVDQPGVQKAAGSAFRKATA